MNNLTIHFTFVAEKYGSINNPVLCLNKFSNFTTDVDGLNIHFIMEKGSGSEATPLLLMHGWPGSVVEFLQIIEKLFDTYFSSNYFL